MSDFWEEYKKRVTYGDALGPPRNATEMGADDLARMGRGPHTPNGGSGTSGGILTLRQMISSAVLSGLAAAGGWGLQSFAGDSSWLYYLGVGLYVVAVISGFFVAQSLAVIVLGGAFLSIAWVFRMRMIRYGVIAGLAGWALMDAGYGGYALFPAAAGAALGLFIDIKKYF
ncbi:MAG: hypothetical protein RBS08_03110 [Bdellovibrionales bacterium]|nr:hypothetical protein [Bdellovibrionales bacterium]